MWRNKYYPKSGKPCSCIWHESVSNLVNRGTICEITCFFYPNGLTSNKHRIISIGIAQIINIIIAVGFMVSPFIILFSNGDYQYLHVFWHTVTLLEGTAQRFALPACGNSVENAIK